MGGEKENYSKRAMSVRMGAKEPLHTVGGKVNRYSHYVKQEAGSSIN